MSVRVRYYACKKQGGIRRERSLGTCDRKIAERRLKEWIGSLEKVDAEVEKTTLSQLIQRYLVVTGSMSESSRVTDQSIIKRFLAWWPHGRDYQVRQIRPSMLDEWLAHEEPRLRNVTYNRYAGFRVAARIACYMNRWEQGRVWLEKASSLNPLDVEIEYDLFDIYQAMRLYPRWTRLLTAHRTFTALDGGWTDMQRAKLKLDTGDVQAARELLAKVPPDFNETQEIWETKFNATLHARDYDAAEKLIAATPDEWTDRVYIGNPPQTWFNGMLARLRGDEGKAQTIFAIARQWTTTRRNEETRERLHYRLISLCDAVLGRKEHAVREARHICEEYPMTRDARIATSYLKNLALVYTLTGERVQALEQLETLSKMYNSITCGELRCSPFWDPLRGDPRFEALIVNFTPKLSP